MAFHEILILLVLVNVYLIAIYWLKRRGDLEGERLSLFGPALMMKTQKGKALIDRIARPRELWKKYGDLCIATVVVFGVLMVGLLLFALTRSAAVPAGREPTPQQILFLPGINPFIPLGYGLLALVIAIIIHEFAHGVLARAHDLKVKSLGLLLLVIPIGAFMEPDEEELQAAHPRARTRVFAAGAGTSILISFLFAGVYSFGFIPMVQPAAPGMGIMGVSPDTPAEEVGVRPGMILVSVQGQPVTNGSAFVEAFNNTEPGQQIPVTIHSDGQRYVVRPQLIDRYEYMVQQCLDRDNDQATCEQRADEDFLALCQSRGYSEARCEERLENDDVHEGFFGVSPLPVPPAELLTLHQPLPSLDRSLGDNFGRLFAYAFLPVLFLSPVNSPIANFFVVTGPLSVLGLGGFWLLANVMYWLFWVNFILGTFNALPLTVLDGGHVFQEGVRKIARRREPPPDDTVVELRVRQATKAMAILIVGLIVLQLVIPWVV